MAGRWLRSQARSRVRGATSALVVGLGSLLATAAFAQQPPLKGDSHRGQILSYTCLGCHGIEGYRNAYPDYAVPRLRGQRAEYLTTALQEYRSGARQHPTMHLQASSLSDQDIADVAAYFSGKPLAATSGATPPEPPKQAAVCTSCHGRDGIAIAPMYPSLAGQHASYIERAIQEYQTGYRKNPIMNGMVASLKPADITAIADYFSGLKPGLQKEPRPDTRWSARNAD